jgi:transcriptional regulator with XRE-family HTH domain
VAKNRQLDTTALLGALEAKKEEEGRSWRDIARELEIDHSTFTRLGKGTRPDVDTLVALTDWLGVGLDTFVSGEATRDERQETLAAIATYLRADKALKPRSAEAIESVLRAAYDQLAEPDKPEPAAR